MDSGIEELAERVEEQNSRQDPGEDFELRIVVLEVHELVGDDAVELVFLQELEEPTRKENAPVLAAYRHGQGVVRFHDADLHAGDILELS